MKLVNDAGGLPTRGFHSGQFGGAERVSGETVRRRTQSRPGGKMGQLCMRGCSILALGDFERYKAAAKRAARIKDGKEHPIYSDLPEFPMTGLF